MREKKISTKNRRFLTSYNKVKRQDKDIFIMKRLK